MEIKIATVSEIMNYNVVTVTPIDNLLTSVSRMNKFGIGSVVVEDSGRPVGILTERDVLRVVEASKDRRMMELVVKDVMTTPIAMVQDITTIEEAAQVMAQRNIRRLPVVRNDKLAGIVTQTDIVKAVGRGILARKVPIFMSDIFRDQQI